MPLGPLAVVKQSEDVLYIRKKLEKRRIRTPGPRELVWLEMLCSPEYKVTDTTEGFHR